MQAPTLSLATRSPGLEDLIEKTRAYIHAAKSPTTLRAYRTDFEDFTRFCAEHNLPHLPATPTTVALYIADRAGSLRSATITRRLTSITKAHQAAGFEESPASSHHFVVSETLKGIRRSIGTAQEGKAPLLTSDIRRIVACCPEALLGLRDRALILVGFAGAFRRSELAAIDLAHLSFTQARNLKLLLRDIEAHSKALEEQKLLAVKAEEEAALQRELEYSGLGTLEIERNP